MYCSWKVQYQHTNFYNEKNKIIKNLAKPEDQKKEPQAGTNQKSTRPHGLLTTTPGPKKLQQNQPSLLLYQIADPIESSTFPEKNGTTGIEEQQLGDFTGVP